MCVSDLSDLSFRKRNDDSINTQVLQPGLEQPCFHCLVGETWLGGEGLGILSVVFYLLFAQRLGLI